MSSSSQGNKKIIGLQASWRLCCGIVLILLFAAQIDAQRSTSLWQTLSDSSLDAYKLAKQTSVADVVLWCEVQLTKAAIGICFPDLNIGNASTIQYVYLNGQKSYRVNGVTTQGWFTIDFSLRDVQNVSLI